MPKTNKKGFTLIELLIVIGIISILAGIVLVAVNPAVQFGKANDSERKSEIGTLLSSIYQFQTSPTARGNLPQCLVGGVKTVIPKCDTDDSGIATGNGGFEGAIEFGTAAASYDCSTALIPSYLREIPNDPATGYDATATGYWICQETVNNVSRLYIIAEGAEVYTDDGGCDLPDPDDATTYVPAMCVSG